MIVGRVRDHSPRVRLTLPGASKRVVVEFVVDTGFEGDLTLPPSLLAQTDAAFVESRVMALADDSLGEYSIYEITLDWQGERQTAEVVAMNGRPLLGMMRLVGSHLHIEGDEGGEVVIELL